jgi:hypothetical protein
MLESTSSLYYLFSPFHPSPRYAFTVFNLLFSCASMILDDCLTIISPPPQLSADPSQSLPTYKFIFTNTFVVHIFLLSLEISLVHLIVPPFSSQPSLQLDLLSCSSVPIRGIIPFLAYCYFALIHSVALHHHVLILSE